MNAQHSAARCEWYTPAEILHAAREVLGPIDLDPASDAIGNETVRAAEFITAEDDGLTYSWSTPWDPVTIWMNPPGRVARKKGESPLPCHRPLPKLFWQRLHWFRQVGGIRHAIVAAFSLEQLQQSQGWAPAPPMVAFPFCIPRSRTKWRPAPGQKGEAPTHSAALIYIPGTEDRSDLFERVFSRFGAVVIPA
jgi:hypothetical protein